jgi:ATP-binding cassette subfamily F protein uup
MQDIDEQQAYKESTEALIRVGLEKRLNSLPSKLSGGERGRLMLARVLAKPSNLLILDEPTNDLDLETLDLLEEMLADYKGTLILVSHDRDFLDRIASSTLMSEGSGRWIEYAGGYSDMVSQRGEGVLSHSNSAVLQKKQNNKNITLHNLSPGDPPVKNKLTFNEQHALQKLPKKIEELSKKKIKLQSILDDSDLYKREPSKFDIATRSLAETDLELSAAEEKWLELEIKKESLGK